MPLSLDSWAFALWLRSAYSCGVADGGNGCPPSQAQVTIRRKRLATPLSLTANLALLHLSRDKRPRSTRTKQMIPHHLHTPYLPSRQLTSAHQRRLRIPEISSLTSLHSPAPLAKPKVHVAQHQQHQAAYTVGTHPLRRLPQVPCPPRARFHQVPASAPGPLAQVQGQVQWFALQWASVPIRGTRD